jgi:hypothetical protein
MGRGTRVSHRAAMSALCASMVLPVYQSSAQSGTILSGPEALVTGASTDMDLRRQPVVAISSSGQVALADGAAFVGVIDGSRQVQRIGRAGSGPGELQGASSLGWLGDTLWVIDGRLRRISWFHAGRLIRAMPYIGGRWGSQLLDLPMALSPQGALVPGMGDGAAETLYKPRRWSVFLASLDGTKVRDSLFDVVDPSGPLTLARGNGMIVLRQPYSMRTLVGWSGTGAWLVRADRMSTDNALLGGASPRLTLRDASGRAIYDVPLPITTRSLPSNEVTQLVDSAVLSLNRNPRLPPVTVAEYRRALMVPARTPALSHLVVLNDGTVLLRRWPSPDGRTDYVVVSPDGRVRTTLQLPSTQRVLAGDARRIIATRENEDGEVDIIEYRWR